MKVSFDNVERTLNLRYQCSENKVSQRPRIYFRLMVEKLQNEVSNFKKASQKNFTILKLTDWSQVPGGHG